MLKFPRAILVVLDGFGIASPSAYNAVSLADPKFFKELIAWYPTRILQASGPAVGLPWGERGNSEVGHLHLGAGRVVTQELPRINRSIADGSFYKNPVLLSAFEGAVKNDGTLHIAGLLGVGSVHSYEQHIYTLLGMCKDLGVKNLALHIFTDGVDSPTQTALPLIKKLEEKIRNEGIGRIATVAGRFYAMDKGEHWDLTQSALNAMVLGDGEIFESVKEAISDRYEKGISDDMIPPSIIGNGKDTRGKISEGDAVIFFNFRSDRMMQMTKLFTTQVKNVRVVTLSFYGPDLPVDVAFMPQEVKDSLGEVISKAGFTQYHVAESDKFAHVTFFFNGHRFEPWPGEERLIINPSDAGFKTYDERAEMEALNVV